MKEESDMKKFLIEVPHGNSRQECEKAIRIFLETGSHFLGKADWGCRDGEHKAWIIAQVPGKKDARNIVPPLYRPTAKIVEVNHFTEEDISDPVRYHKK
jgi:hypothetical protein